MGVYGFIRAGALALGLTGLVSGFAAVAAAEPFMVGPEECAECHENEHEVWEQTPHAESFRDLHRNRDARGYLRAVGDRRPQQSETCQICHYTMAQDGPDAEPEAVAGPSCESCHGAASEWIEVHNDYGGKDVKREQESAAHKQQRVQQAKAAGMIWPQMKYAATRNCLQCHGMNTDELDGATMTKLLDAEHPINGEFEYIKYSQGVVRHRFYPPQTDVNQELTPALKSEWFAVGQAASLVAANESLDKTDNARYQEAMQQRIAFAERVLSQIPEASQVLAEPSDANARAFAEAIEGKDLTGAVGNLMPAESDYIQN